MSPTGMVIQDVHGLAKVLDGPRFWDAIERTIPRALAPVAQAARQAAPRGRTGKLTRSPYEVRTRRRFFLGTVLEAAIGTLAPYGHLVERGHRIVARGPARTGGRVTRAQRAARRASLRERRATGRGSVTGRFFALRAFEQREAAVGRLIEKLLEVEVRR